ncbi:MAG: peptidylprolyl isomerase [Defluviitaleaceae bacterium]|nr:peptidylprolyl isomerase [Defluviitaleaceae bacterium]
MKKFINFKMAIVFIFIIALMFSLTACGGREGGEDEVENGESSSYAEETPRGDNENAPEEETPRRAPAEFDMWVSGESTGPGVTVATVNGHDIGIYDVQFRVSEAEWTVQMEMLEGNEPASMNTSVREEAVRLAAVPVLFMQFAAENGIVLNAEDLAGIEENIIEIIEWHGEEEFLEMIQDDGIESFAHLEYILNVFTLVDKVIEHIVADPAKFAPFEQYMEEMLGAKHILITLEEFDDDEDAAMAFAQGIWARAVAGEDFDMLMETYSEDPGKEFSPQGYTFTAGQMVPEFEQGTRDLEIGGISEPIRAFHGIHIIKRIEPNPEDLMGSSPWDPPPTEEDRMGNAIYRGFEEKAKAADIVFLPELSQVPVL